MWPPHAIYIALIEIKHVPDEKQASIRVKVFTDDLGAVLQNSYKKGLNIENGQPCKEFSSIIESYFQQNFICTINEKAGILKFLSCQKEGDTSWLSFELSCPPQWQKVKIKSNFFMELFPAQSNVFNIQNGEEKRFFRLTHANQEQHIKF